MISFIIPYFNHWDLCHQRLAEFYKFIYHKYDIEIILINDTSTDSDCETGVKFWQGVYNSEKKILRYHRNEVNGGFGYSMNVGTKLAKGDWICLYSNDVIMSGDFLVKLFELNGDNHGNILFGGEVINYPAGWNEFQASGNRSIYLPYANGWFLMFGKDDRLKFDVETFGKFDFEDMDLSTQARGMGYNLVYYEAGRACFCRRQYCFGIRKG